MEQRLQENEIAPVPGPSTRPDDCDENIVLFLVQNRELKCDKRLIMAKSIYFRTILSGHFTENNEERVLLKGVEFETFRDMIKLMYNEVFINTMNEITVANICRAANMFFINNVKHACGYWIIIHLNRENCLRMWLAARASGLIDVAKKAKLVALTEFKEMSFSNSLYQMDLDALCEYLGSVQLNCSSEMQVFLAAMHWYYEGSTISTADEQKKGNIDEVFLKILFCVDFKNVSDDEIIKMCPYVKQSRYIKNILMCVLHTKQGHMIEEFDEIIQCFARILLSSKTRSPEGYPCILVKRQGITTKDDLHVIEQVDEVTKKNKFVLKKVQNKYSPYKSRTKVPSDLYPGVSNNPGTSSSTNICTTVQIRYSHNSVAEKLKEIEDASAERTGSLTAFYVDLNDNFKLKKLTDIAPNYNSTHGLALVGYKQHFFVFGAQSGGNWIDQCWRYDPVKGYGVCLELPFRRKDFGFCVVGNRLYICGGWECGNKWRASYYFLDLDECVWSKMKSLPTNCQDIKCSDFKQQLALFSLEQMSLWLLSPSVDEDKPWEHIQLKFFSVPPRIKSYDTKVMFSYNNLLYLYNVDTDLIEVYLEEYRESKEEFSIKRLEEPTKNYEGVLNSVLIHDELFSFIKEKDIIGSTVSLVKFNIKTKEYTVIFKRGIDEILEDEFIGKYPQFYKFHSNCPIFTTNLVDCVDMVINILPFFPKP